MTLDHASQAALLALARASIAESLGLEHETAPTSLPVFDLRQGAFVTLTDRGRLRGCVGRLEADSALRSVIPDIARSAAFADPRFTPLGPGELARIRIEISLLSAPVAIASPSDVQIGRDGVIVERRGARGLLLPQVAVEHGWTAEQLVEHACTKASLAVDAWRRPGVVMRRFEAEVFAEPKGLY